MGVVGTFVTDHELASFAVLCCIVISLTLFILYIFIPATLAAELTPEETRVTLFSYGTRYNYSEVVLPNNSYVHQGENISQGKYYDLTGIYGFSGNVAMWSYDYGVGDLEPTKIVRLTHAYKTYIDKDKFPVGRWYQWDGRSCDSDGFCSNGFGNGNNYVFAVVPYVKENQSNSANIVVKSGSESYEIPVTVANPVPQTPYTTPTPDIAAQNITTIVIPTEIPTVVTAATAKDGSATNITVITPKSGIPMFVPLLALGLMGVLAWRRK